MKVDNLSTIDQMGAFLEGTQAVAFAVATNKVERYLFVELLLSRFAYPQLKRPEKGIVIRFLQKVTGYSRQQLTRMIQRYVEQGQLKRYQQTLTVMRKKKKVVYCEN